MLKTAWLPDGSGQAATRPFGNRQYTVWRASFPLVDHSPGTAAVGLWQWRQTLRRVHMHTPGRGSDSSFHGRFRKSHSQDSGWHGHSRQPACGSPFARGGLPHSQALAPMPFARRGERDARRGNPAYLRAPCRGCTSRRLSPRPRWTPCQALGTPLPRQPQKDLGSLTNGSIDYQADRVTYKIHAYKETSFQRLRKNSFSPSAP
jgi:hypothetical protein